MPTRTSLSGTAARAASTSQQATVTNGRRHEEGHDVVMKTQDETTSGAGEDGQEAEGEGEGEEIPEDEYEIEAILSHDKGRLEKVSWRTGVVVRGVCILYYEPFLYLAST